MYVNHVNAPRCPLMNPNVHIHIHSKQGDQRRPPNFLTIKYKISMGNSHKQRQNQY